MKSLLITFDFPPIVSGISTAFYYTWKYLPEAKCIILAPRAKGSRELDKQLGCKIYRLYMPVGNNIFKKIARAVLLFCYCLFIIKRENIELLICGQPIIVGSMGLIFKGIYHIPYYVWAYGAEVVKFKKSRWIMFVLRKVLGDTDKLIVNSEFTRGVYREFGIPLKKIIKVTPGVDTERFKPGISVKGLISRYKLDGKRVILTVARLTRRKGHDAVIKALDKIREKFPDVCYLIVGTGPEEKRLKEMAADYYLEDKVIFTGYVDEQYLPGYYNLCDIYAMPNREAKDIDPLEGFGISFVEASACEKPVIGGKSGGSSEAVEDGVTGYLVDPLDIDSIARRITELLSNRDFAQKMGREGRQRVIQNFKWQQKAMILKGYV